MAAFLLMLAAAARQLGRRRGRREAEDAFDMPEDVFRQHFLLRKETVRWLCDEVAEELGGVRSTTLSVERQVCALRFFATGSFQGSVGSEETIGVTQPAVSKCVRRVAEAIVHAGTCNKWVHIPRTSEEKSAVKKGFLRRGCIPGVIGCVDGSLIAIIAPKGDNKAAYMCSKGFYALDSMFVSDSGYLLEPWLLTPVPGHPPTYIAEGRYNTAHASMRSVVERCIGLLKSRFHCLQSIRWKLTASKFDASASCPCLAYSAAALKAASSSGCCCRGGLRGCC
ncbi:putative nuclease HARBI1 [Dermacentor silvarum]|uniref:putative nuclease HARBI1 n=1 Tax=Dermacentor silvarum TaxID=543639 RepID=UPI0021016776|nr:putative nuclease HARBI1 [Dermacentor silvarum]